MLCIGGLPVLAQPLGTQEGSPATSHAAGCPGTSVWSDAFGTAHRPEPATLAHPHGLSSTWGAGPGSAETEWGCICIQQCRIEKTRSEAAVFCSVARQAGPTRVSSWACAASAVCFAASACSAASCRSPAGPRSHAASTASFSRHFVSSKAWRSTRRPGRSGRPYAGVPAPLLWKIESVSVIV